ncbi:MAG: radical SAM protein [Desulfobacterales bacterium]|nr:radical SAM protein [Desulfobacterales bacterium]
MKKTHKLKILFVCPKVSTAYMGHVEDIANKRWKGETFFNRDLKRHERFTNRVFYGLGLLTLASSLGKEFAFDFIDENFEKNDLEHLYANCLDYDLVAITGQVIQWKRTEKLIKFFKQKGLYVVVGGVHATTFPDVYFQEGISVVLGEGEPLFKEFLNDFLNRRPKPVYQKSKSGKNLSPGDIPVLDFEIAAKYRYNVIGVQTTRGCPYRCNYCNVSNILGEAYRHKPVEAVLEEITRIKQFWPDSLFFFFDDNLFADKTYAIELFSALQGTDLGQWGAHADVSIYQNPELLDLIAQSGQPKLAFGFETLSKQNVGKLGNEMKQNLMPKYGEALTELKRRNIDVTGSFMLGFKGDSHQTVEMIFDFLEMYEIEAYITRYSAIPDTKLYLGLLEDYTKQHGPVKEKGIEQALLINKYLNRLNGFGKWETEDIILDILKTKYTDRLPVTNIEALAVYRSFYC